MKDNLQRAITGFAAFVVVCLVGTAAMLMIFGQSRFQEEQVFKAEFTNVNGLDIDDFVRIAGVEVGKVKGISINSDAHAVVEFSADPSVVLTQGTRAAVRWANPFGDRFLALEEGVGGLGRLDPGQIIPVQRTVPALDLDALLGGFRPLFRALNPEQVNALTSQLISAFQGQGATVGSFLTQAAAFTNTMADRDQLIGEVIDNLNTVVGTLSGQSDQVGRAVDALSAIMTGLAERKSDISSAIAYTNVSSATIADLLDQARKPLADTVTQTERTADIVVADHEYFDNLVNTLPDAYRKMTRLGLYGDFFSFYLCDVILKLNGKGGQPVYVKAAGQDSGRCAPK